MSQHKHYSPAFKLEVVKLMVKGQYSTKQECEASGAGATAVKRWKQQYLAEKAGYVIWNIGRYQRTDKNLCLSD